MNEYERKQEARRERLEAAAERARREGNARVDRARDMASVIPFGQPILVGHHSEGRDRRYRGRIDNNFRKGFEALDRAKELESRAASVGSGGISSDDPDAIAKLREELAKVERLQTFMAGANKIVRAFYKAGVRDEASGDLYVRYLAKLREIEPTLSEKNAKAMLVHDNLHGIGFASYQLSNNGANVRRIKARIADLERRAKAREVIEAEIAAAEAAGAAPPNETTINGVRIVENVTDNRLQMFFPGKPAYEVRAQLKSYGFRWSPMAGAWQRHLSGGAKYSAETIAKGAGGAA